jgi:preprotein translocase subunit Sec61beta
MTERKMRAPPGMAGLVRYFEEEKSKIRIKPHYVLLFCWLIIIIEILLRFV